MSTSTNGAAGISGTRRTATHEHSPASPPNGARRSDRSAGAPSNDQKLARTFGVLFVLTFLTSIPAAILFQPVLNDPAAYLTGAASDTPVYLAALLEFFLIIANIGTAVVLYPIARRHSEVLAIGYITARAVECIFIAAGIIFVLGIVSLRQDSPDAVALAESLAALKGWTFLFGPGLVVPFGNGLLLGYLMYNSGLIPRPLAALGLVAGPVLLVGNLGVLFGQWEVTGAVGLFVAPEFAWELLLGLYAALWGFRRSAPALTRSAQ